MKTALKLLTGVAATISMGIVAQGQDLFKDLSQAESFALESATLGENPGFGIGMPTIQDGHLRSRKVSLDVNAAKAMFDMESPAFSTTLELFPGRQVKLNMSDFDGFVGGGAKSWSGRVEGFEDGFATLVLIEDRIIGQVQYGGEIYRIVPNQTGVHVISEITTEFLPDESPVMPSPAGPSVNNAPMPTMQNDIPSTGRVNVLVIYTNTAREEAIAAAVAPRDEAILAIAMANTALSNTRLLNYKYRFAGIRSAYCAYDETMDGSYSALLSAITDDMTCVGGRAAMRRDEFSADLVSVIRAAGGGSCGVGWLNETLHGGSSAFGFSLTSRNCISGHTMSHEMGHNLGLHHDRFAVGSTDQMKHNFGIALPMEATPIRTVMAYNSECSAMGVSCTRVPIHTNAAPMGLWTGVRLGRPLSMVDPAVNTLKIQENWNTIAAWK